MKNITSSQKQTSSYWAKSRCKGSWLHRFNIVDAGEDYVKEVCSLCGKSIFHKVFYGQTDNNDYLKYHARQALFPQHQLYYHEYHYEQEVLNEFYNYD